MNKVTKLKKIFKDNDLLPFEMDVDDNGEVLVAVPVTDVTLDADLPLEAMYDRIRDALVDNAEYILEHMQGTEYDADAGVIVRNN